MNQADPDSSVVHFTHLTPGEAAKLLRRSVQTLANWRVMGRGPRFIKNPGRNGGVLYDRAELERWLAGNTFGSTAEALPAAS